MRIVIAGAGEVGIHLAKMLSNNNHDIIVIDPDEENLKYVGTGIDLLTVSGSATSVNTLNEADVATADLFIAVVHTEEINITAAILAKRMGAKKAIARIDNQEYLEEGNLDSFRQLGIDYLIYPEAIAAKEIIGLLHQTGSSEIIEIAGGRLAVYVIKLDRNAPIIGKSLKEVALDMDGIEFRAVAIKRGDHTIIPKGDDYFIEEDVVYAIATKTGVNELMKFSGKEKFLAKNIMILGGSRIGIKTAEGLGNHHNTKLVEMDREKSYKISNFLKNTLVIHGDGRDMDLLNEEKLERMDAFVAVTGSSETNILACLHAKHIGVKKTIAEVENFNYIELAENLGIDTIINKKLGAASRIYRFTMASGHISSIKKLRGTSADLVEIVVAVDSKVTQKAIKDLKFPKNCIIGGVIRGSNVMIATGDTQLQVEDRVIAVATPSAIKDLGKMFM